MWIRMSVEVMSVYCFMDTSIWFLFCIVTTDSRPDFQWNMDTFDGRRMIYLLQLCIWIIFCFIDSRDIWVQSQVSLKAQLLFIFFCSNPYISKFYSIDLNSRLPPHTIYVVYLDYILPLLLCVHFPLTYKMGGCWNLLE